MLDKFETSVNKFDHIFMLKLSPYGVWLSMRGSSIIYLYDEINFNCKFIFDIKTNEAKSDLKVCSNFSNLNLHFEI